MVNAFNFQGTSKDEIYTYFLKDDVLESPQIYAIVGMILFYQSKINILT